MSLMFCLKTKVNNVSYPSRVEIEWIRNYDLWKDGPAKLFENIEEMYNEDYGRVIKKYYKKKVRITFITGGWSGNEEILSAMKRVKHVGMFWVKSERGGLECYEYPKEWPPQKPKWGVKNGGN